MFFFVLVDNDLTHGSCVFAYKNMDDLNEVSIC